MYTSGSTGIPKGVIIPHQTLLKAIQAFFTIEYDLTQNDIYIAYLPLAHMMELYFELFFYSLGIPIGYSSPLTLTDNSTGIETGCKSDTTVLKPTVMPAVPLILDRIRKGITEEVQTKGQFFNQLFNFAIDYKNYWIKNGFKTV